MARIQQWQHSYGEKINYIPNNIFLFIVICKVGVGYDRI